MRPSCSEGPRAVVWIFPQGKIEANDVRPLRFQNGIRALVREAGRVRVVPLALRYEFWQDERPEALVRFGERTAVDRSDLPNLIPDPRAEVDRGARRPPARLDRPAGRSLRRLDGRAGLDQRPLRAVPGPVPGTDPRRPGLTDREGSGYDSRGRGDSACWAAGRFPDNAWMRVRASSAPRAIARPTVRGADPHGRSRPFLGSFFPEPSSISPEGDTRPRTRGDGRSRSCSPPRSRSGRSTPISRSSRTTSAARSRPPWSRATWSEARVSSAPSWTPGPFPNLFLVEPPIYAQVVASIRPILGFDREPTGPLVSAAAIALGAWGLFGLARRREGRAVALLAVVAVRRLPGDDPLRPGLPARRPDARVRPGGAPGLG